MQDSDHAKEQARCTLCIHRSLSKDPTSATQRNKRATHCMHIVLFCKHPIRATRRNKRPTHCVCLVLSAKTRHTCKPREGTSALDTLSTSFFKQRSDISHAKKQARCTLCIHHSLSKDPTKATRTNKRARHCVYIGL